MAPTGEQIETIRTILVNLKGIPATDTATAALEKLVGVPTGFILACVRIGIFTSNGKKVYA